MPPTITGPFFQPLMQQLQGLADTGGVLSTEQHRSLQDLTGVLPDSRIGNAVKTAMTRALESVPEGGLPVTENLISIIGIMDANFGDGFVDKLSVEGREVAGRLLYHFGISPPSSIPPAMSLLSPEGAAAVRYRHGRVATAITRILRSSGEIGEGIPLSRLPKNFFIAGHPVEGENDSRVPALLQRVFGRPVSLRQILECFNTGGDDSFVMKTLHIDHQTDGGVHFHGTFMNAFGKFVGNFETTIDPRPAGGDSWICRAGNFHIEAVHRKMGFGTVLLRHYLKFLFDLGVDALETQAETNGRYFYPSVGFSPIRRQIFDEVKQQFLNYLDHRGLLTSDRRIEIDSAKDLWQIADYTVAEERVGKPFLADSLTISLQLRFWLRPDYPGWLRVLGKEARYPPEWNHLQEETRAEILSHFSQFEWMLEESLLSDEKEADLLAERVLNWSLPVGGWLSKMERNATQDEPMPEEMARMMRMIADTLNMITDHASDGVKLYFRRCLVNRRGDFPGVLQAIRARGLEVHYSL